MEQMREKYESLSLVVLKDLAKARGIKGVSAMKKGDLVERMLQEDEKDKLKKAASHPVEKKETEAQTEEKKEERKNEAQKAEAGLLPARRNGRYPGGAGKCAAQVENHYIPSH